MSDLEVLGLLKGLRILLSDIVDLTGKGRGDLAQVGWYLEFQHAVFVI